MLSLIASTTTTTGLTVQSYLRYRDPYPTGISVSDEEMDALHIERAELPPRVELHHHCAIKRGVSPKSRLTSMRYILCPTTRRMVAKRQASHPRTAGTREPSRCSGNAHTPHQA